MGVSARGLLEQLHEIYYITIIPISASLGFLFKGVQAMKCQAQGSYKYRFFYVGFYCNRQTLVILEEVPGGCLCKK